MNRHLISAADLSRDDALLVLDTADELAQVAGRAIKKLPTLRGRTVVNLFFEDSTRTRISFEAAAKRLSADVIMMLRVQAERMSAAYFPSVREYSRRYGLDAVRLALLPEQAIVMHPGPMNRGVEIAADVADCARSTVTEQVANGVSVRMAVLYLLLGGAGEGA